MSGFLHGYRNTLPCVSDTPGKVVVRTPERNVTFSFSLSIVYIIMAESDGAVVERRTGEDVSGKTTESAAAIVAGGESGASGIVPKLQNVVATINLGCKVLYLKQIALHARNAEYNPKRFAAVIMRIREPKSTALIFSSGKMVCTGSKSEDQARLAARKFARILQKLGNPVSFKEFKIQNMVGSCDVKFPIRLEGLATSHSMFCSYEPELFPGLIYRMQQPKIVLLIFVSGKVVLTGAKKRSEIYTAFENIYPVLQEYKKGSGISLPPSQQGLVNGDTPPALPAAAEEGLGNPAATNNNNN